METERESECEEDKVKLSWAPRAGRWLRDGWTPATEGLVSICVSPCESGVEEKLRNKNPLSRYLSNRLCLPGDRDWHHFLLVCTQCSSVKKKKKKAQTDTWMCHECVRLRKVHVFVFGRLSSAPAAHSPSGTWQDSVCAGFNSHALCVWLCACEDMIRKQTVGIYEESQPCAHAVSLIVHYAKGNTANWCHLVGLLGTRGLSMVPRHIGVVKINTVTLFGRKRHWTIYYCVYFSLSLTLRVQAAFTQGGSRTVETLAGLHQHNAIMCRKKKCLHSDEQLLQSSLQLKFI